MMAEVPYEISPNSAMGPMTNWAANKEKIGKIPKTPNRVKPRCCVLRCSIRGNDAWNVFVCIFEDLKHKHIS